ncbi:MAG TPA: hypothetical protein QF641_04320 [Candidatus Thalassarchaeaceae archaeon]|jgi:hypothetical protein|nr:hypothetical protein [Candidatus Thalassarchaeaceae archaeon]|tara:strand:- start:17246 stop:18505 length:1260 start_codon:yes stop_codon:yes gene_type:complete
MVGFPGAVDEESPDGPSTGSGMLKAFASPTTLPHLLAMILATGSLYVIMKINFLGSESIGGVVFLSLTITYCFAAIVTPTKLGRVVFAIEDNGGGIISSSYWRRSGFSLMIVTLISASISILIISILEEGWWKNITWGLAMVFILMSVVQAFSLSFGWFSYGKRKSVKNRASRISGVYTLFRVIFSLVLFIPLVWWFGYNAGDVANGELMEHGSWILFIIIVATTIIIADKLTKSLRQTGDVDGLVIDRVVFLVALTACWHLLSAWRRNPLLVEKATGSMLLEEGLLMGITVILSVWSMANRNKKKGRLMFQGQSAVYWGIGFGYLYAGSVSSLSIISKGSLLTTTALGHMLTAIVMLCVLPFTISRIGGVAANVMVDVTNSLPEGTLGNTSSVSLGNNGGGEHEPPEYQERDVIELLD